MNAEEVLVTWTKPENPAGRISSYNVYVEPPHPAMVLSVEADYNNATQAYPVQSSLYRRDVEYSFWVGILCLIDLLVVLAKDIIFNINIVLIS